MIASLSLSQSSTVVGRIHFFYSPFHLFTFCIGYPPFHPLQTNFTFRYSSLSKLHELSPIVSYRPTIAMTSITDPIYSDVAADSSFIAVYPTHIDSPFELEPVPDEMQHTPYPTPSSSSQHTIASKSPMANLTPSNSLGSCSDGVSTDDQRFSQQLHDVSYSSSSSTDSQSKSDIIMTDTEVESLHHRAIQNVPQNAAEARNFVTEDYLSHIFNNYVDEALADDIQWERDEVIGSGSDLFKRGARTKLKKRWT